MAINAFTPTKSYADGNRWTKQVMDDFVDALDTWINAEVETKCPDKTGTETISGTWTFSSQPTFAGLKTSTNTILRSDGDVWTLPDLGNVNFVSDTGAQTLSNKTFTGTDALLVPTSAPTTNRSMALVSDVLQVYDSTGSAKPYLRTDTFATATYTGGSASIGTTNDGGFSDVDSTNMKLTFTVATPGRYRVTCQFTYDALGTAASTMDTQTFFRLSDGTTNSDPSGTARFSSGAATGAFNVQYPFSISWVFNFSTSGSKTVTLQKQNNQSTNITTRRVLAGTSQSFVMDAVRVAD